MTDISFSEDPDTCPACGDPLIDKTYSYGTEWRTYGCGLKSYIVYRDVEGDEKWRFRGMCVNALDAAIRFKKENSDLKQRVAELEKSLDETEKQMNREIREVMRERERRYQDDF